MLLRAIIVLPIGEQMFFPSSNIDLSEHSVNQLERLAFIEYSAYFLGEIGRKTLQDRFGIKEAAASRDLTLYNDIAPGNIIYNPRLRYYEPSSGFKCVFKYSTERLLSTMAEGYGDGVRNDNDSPIACEAPKLSQPDQRVLSVVTRSLNLQKPIEITYRSLSSGETRREIIPHALVDNALRWHVRAYDRRRNRFTDFVINRISEPKFCEIADIAEHESQRFDKQWNTEITLELVPHPRLNYKETIEKDYGMKQGVLKRRVRAALAGYVLRRWNVDCSSNHELDGQEYHLYCRNIKALKKISELEISTLTLAPGFNTN
jgi:hypothetical protein